MTTIERTCDLDGIQVVENVHCSFFTGEQNAHTFVIRGRDSGVDFSLSGTVSAKFLQANGTTLTLTGSIVDGAAVVTLTQACYSVPGAFTFSIYVSADGATTCVYSCRGTVTRTKSEIEHDGGTVISDLTALLTAAGSLQTQIGSTSYDFFNTRQTPVEGVHISGWCQFYGFGMGILSLNVVVGATLSDDVDEVGNIGHALLRRLSAYAFSADGDMLQVWVFEEGDVYVCCPGDSIPAGTYSIILPIMVDITQET